MGFSEIEMEYVLCVAFSVYIVVSALFPRECHGTSKVVLVATMGVLVASARYAIHGSDTRGP